MSVENRYANKTFYNKEDKVKFEKLKLTKIISKMRSLTEKYRTILAKTLCSIL